MLVCGAVLLVAAAITLVIFNTEPEARRTGATRETAMLVDVVRVERSSYRPEFRVVGTVEPARDIRLSPRVSGQVVERHPGFVPGGYVAEGTPLLQIDPVDYRQVLAQRRADVRQAEAELAIEQGRADVAREDYVLLGEMLQDENRDLVLRKPQLESARSRVDSARAARDQAELALARTTIRAPFDAQVISRNANLGSQVAPGEDLGRLVGADHYWVAVNVPQRLLRWLVFPGGNGDGQGSPAAIRNRTAWEEGESRSGHLYRLVGVLSEDTRMARVLITVDDPLARREENRGAPALMIGAFVEAAIRGRELEDVVRLNRDYLRQDETVWVMADDKLDIRPVSILMEDARFAYIDTGLDAGEDVLTTNLASVTEGASLRRKADNVENGNGGVNR